jgi:hypothetical protein
MTFPTGIPNSTPVYMIALVELAQYLWSGRLPNVQPGGALWVRTDQVPSLLAAGYIRAPQNGDPGQPPPEPDLTVKGSAGFAAGTTNSGPGWSPPTPAGPPPRSQV